MTPDGQWVFLKDNPIDNSEIYQYNPIMLSYDQISTPPFFDSAAFAVSDDHQTLIMGRETVDGMRHYEFNVTTG